MKKTSIAMTIFLAFILLLTGCETRQTPSESSSIQGEVIITGEIKNRDFYPHVNELVLHLPFFKKGQTSYTTDITDDNRFYFSFQLHAEMCEVSIKPYAEHLYVQPGDSIHLSIDFKDILNPVITGDGAELNRQMSLYTEGGYYMEGYRIWNDFKTNAEFEQLMEKEYQERLNRYEEYAAKHQPSEKVKKYINEMLKADYYKAYLEHLCQCRYNRIESIDYTLYADKMKEAAPLFNSKVITNAHFLLAESIYAYLRVLDKKTQTNAPSQTLEGVLSPMKDTPAMPYLFALGLSSSLYHLNDTTYFNMQKENFDRYIDTPYLRNAILKMQQSKKGYLENPKPISDYILYGRYQDAVKALPIMPHMKPFYDLLNKHQGKMIYLDFWAPWCPPCLAEMEPLKELRKRYAPEDIVFITICRSKDRKRFEEVLEKNGMHVPGIEHILTGDWPNDDRLYMMYNQLNVNSFPYYFIINREGVIVNYGNMMRPSYPGTAECMDEWLEKG